MRCKADDFYSSRTRTPTCSTLPSKGCSPPHSKGRRCLPFLPICLPWSWRPRAPSFSSCAVLAFSSAWRTGIVLQHAIGREAGAMTVKSVGSDTLHVDQDLSVAFKPLRAPRLNASPCDRLRILTKPVICPSSPSFSILRFARASSPVQRRQLC